MSNHNCVTELNFSDPKVEVSSDKSILKIEIENSTGVGDRLILNLPIASVNLLDIVLSSLLLALSQRLH